jgi:hypothetical protein
MTRTATANPVAEAIREALITPNECDSNGEAAGPTDGLFALARAVQRLAEATEGLATATENGLSNVADATRQGLKDVGDKVHWLVEVLEEKD